MADKKITELQLISALTDDADFAVDNGIQTYRTTSPQLYAYMKSKTWLQTTQVKTANYTVLGTDSMILANSTGGSIDITLHTAVGYTGKLVNILFTGTANSVVIKTTSAQTIGGRASAVTKLFKIGDFIEVVSDGANWQIVKIKESLKFHAYDDASLSIPNDGAADGNPVIFPSVIYNYGTMYNVATGLATVPVSGTYGYSSMLLSGTLLLAAFHWELIGVKEPGGTPLVVTKDWIAGNGSSNTVNAVKVSGIVELAAGETFDIESAGIGQTLDTVSTPGFSAFQFWKIP